MTAATAVSLLASPLWSVQTMPVPVTDASARFDRGETLEESQVPIPLAPSPAATNETR